MRLFALLAVLAAFSLYTGSVMLSDGVLGFLALSGREPWGLQLLLDLLVMLALFSLWLWRDAPAHGIPRWPYVLLALTGGASGALFYLVHREVVRRRRARSAVAV